MTFTVEESEYIDPADKINYFKYLPIDKSQTSSDNASS
jgi:hypothetical protein